MGKFIRSLKKKMGLRVFTRKKDSHFRELPQDTEQVKELRRQLKASEQDRGYAIGQAISESAKRKKAEKLLDARKEVNVTEILSEREKTLHDERYRGSISLKKFLEYSKKNPIRVASYNKKRIFGILHDIAPLSDGRLSVVVRDKQGKLHHIISGSTVKDIFRNYAGLVNEAKSGIICVNLNEEFGYVENIGEKEVPNIINDGHGNLYISKFDVDKVLNQISKKDTYINEVVQYAKSLESQLGISYEESMFKELGENLNLTRASSTEAALIKGISDVRAIQQNYGLQAGELAKTADQQKLYEELVEELHNTKDGLFQMVAKHFPEDKMKKIEEEYNDREKNIIHKMQMLQSDVRKSAKQEQPVTSTSVVPTTQTQPKAPVRKP